MRIHAMARTMRRFSPLLYLIILVLFVRFLKQLPLNGTDHSPPGDSAIAVPTPEAALSTWLVVETVESSACYPLAARFHDWHILLLGVKDKASVHSKCHYLDAGDFVERCDQFDFGDCGEKMTSYARSMIVGQYLLAAGASYVYIAPRGVDPRSVPKPTSFENNSKNSSHLVYGSSKNKNDLLFLDGHFGCNISALDKKQSSLVLSKSTESNDYHLCSNTEPIIQASPVLFSIQSCDNEAPALLINPGKYVLFSMEGVVLAKEAIWLFGLLPFDKEDLNKDETLIFTAIVQKIVWYSNQQVKISYDNSLQTTFNNIKAIDKFSKFVDFVGHSSCSGYTFQDCVTYLLTSVQKKFNILKSYDDDTLFKWMAILERYGFEFPELEVEKSKSVCSKVMYSALSYSRPIQQGATWRKVKYPITNMDVIVSTYKSTCQQAEAHKEVPFTTPWTQFGDILLIVIFNKPHYEALPYVEMLYAPFFPHIVYCGPGFPDRKKFAHLYTHSGGLNRSFISYGGTPEGHFKGAFNYECVSRAIQMQYNVAGYLTIADDVLLWVHKLQKLPKTSVWFLPEKEVRIGDIRTLRECRLGMCDFFPHWNWWEDYKDATTALLSHMATHGHDDPLVNTCYNNLIRLNGAEYRANGAYSDVYYIPSRLASDFSEMAQMFLQYKVFLEIAVPTILRCLEPPENFQEIKGTISWDITDRDRPWTYFTPSYVVGRTFMHPCKWGYLQNATARGEYTRFMCDRLIPYLYDPYERFQSSIV